MTNRKTFKVGVSMNRGPVHMRSESASKESLLRALGVRSLLVVAVAIAVFIGSAQVAVSGGTEPGLGDIGLGDIGKMGGPDGFGGLGGPGSGPGMGFPGGPGMGLPEGPGMDGPGGAPDDDPDTPKTPKVDDTQDNKS